MARTVDEEIAWRRREVERSQQAIRELDAGAFAGRSLPLVRAVLQSTLELHQKTLADLEATHVE